MFKKTAWLLTSLLLLASMVMSACAPAAPAAEPTKAPAAVEPTKAPAAAEPTKAPAAAEPTKAPAAEGGFQIPDVQEGKFNVTRRWWLVSIAF